VYPDTPKFLEAFSRFNLYGSRYRKVVLEAIERAGEHKEPAMLADAQVEHIMPQTLSDLWRSIWAKKPNRFTDLASHTWKPDPDRLQCRTSNKPFAEKCKEYKSSNIPMTRALADLHQWSEAEIRQRGEAMAKGRGNDLAGTVSARPPGRSGNETSTDSI